MSNQILPLPAGTTWDIKKTPNWGTIIQSATSGREVRVTNRVNPIWDFELSFEWLPNYIPLGVLSGSVPNAPTFTSVVDANLPAATYYAVTTWAFAYGESQPSPESNSTVTAGHTVKVTHDASPPADAIGWNCYMGTFSGGEVKQNGTPIPLGATYTVDNAGDGVGLLAHPGALIAFSQSNANFPANVVPPLEDFGDFQTLLGFFNARQGAFDNFLLVDPSDCFSDSIIGVGDGTTEQFQLQRNFGSFFEAIQNPLGPVAIYFDGVPQTTGWALNSTGLVSFSSAPGSGVQISANFCFFYRVRFADDANDYNNFQYNLWEWQKMALKSVKL